MTDTDRNGAPLKYERLADFVEELVVRGTLQPGMRAPSLRTLARQHAMSLSTAMQAYRRLEDRGVLTARPRSGFYVAARPLPRLAPPSSSLPSTARRARFVPGTLALIEQSADKGLVPLGCAVPSAAILDARRLDLTLARLARHRGVEYNTYTVARGDKRLREEIVRRASAHGQLLRHEDLIVTGGCTEALGLAIAAQTSPGDTVAIESPTYFGLLQLLESRGLRVLELPTDARDGVSPAALDTALARQPVALCLLASSFHNPLGFSIDDDAKRALLDVLRRHRVPLIEDDVYGDIHFEARRPRPFSALEPNADVTYCSSFSKTLAPGYRVGWVASRRRNHRLLELKMASSLSGFALAQAAVAEFLASGGYDAHLRRLRAALAMNVDRMLRAIEAGFPDGTRVSRPGGGFVLWVELAPATNARRVYERALGEGICVAPGELFTAGRRYRHCLRLSCGHAWDEDTRQAIETLGRLAGEECGSSRASAG